MITKPLNTNKQIVVSNQINEARFKMSKAEQKLFLYCVGVVDNKNNVLNTSFEMSVKDFANFLELKGNDIYENMIKTTYSMAGRVVEFVDGKNQLIQMPVLSKVTYNKGFVELKVNSELAPYLIDLKVSFTKYSLSEVLTLKSTYSMRLYQILCQWRYRQEVTYTVEKLRFMLDIEVGEYTRYNDFKKDVLEKAFKEINKSSTLKFSYKEVKTGRKITDIVFTIHQSNQPKKTVEDETIPIEKAQKEKIEEKIPEVNFVMIESQKKSSTMQRLVTIGLSKVNSLKLLNENGEDFIVFALEKSKIETRAKVENRGGYFSSLIPVYREMYKEEEQRAEEAKKQAKINEDLKEQKEKELQEKQNAFNQYQEFLSRDLLELEPETFCKKVYSFFDIFISINWGFSDHPDWESNRVNGKKEENIRIAKEIRSKFLACTSLETFKNMIEQDEDWIFKSVFNKQEEFDQDSSEYYRTKNNMNRINKVILPFTI